MIKLMKIKEALPDQWQRIERFCGMGRLKMPKEKTGWAECGEKK